MNDTTRQALAPDDAPLHKKPDLGLMRRLWRYVHPYRMVVLWTLLLAVAAGGLRVAQPLLARHIIDTEVAAGNTRGVWLMSVCLLLLFLGAAGLEMLYNYLTTAVGQR